MAFRRSKPAPQEDPFQQQINEFEAFISDTPVPRGDVLEMVGNIEATGNQQVGRDRDPLALSVFSEAMHGIYGKLVSLEVKPQFTTEQSQRIKGQYAVYKSLAESSVPKQAGTPKPTDTNRVPTDNRK